MKPKKMGNRKMYVPVIFGMTRYELVVQIVGDVGVSVLSMSNRLFNNKVSVKDRDILVSRM